MKIIIAEKPSYASTIANALKKNEGGFIRKNGYMIGNKGNYIITWVFGHLFRLYTIEEYENIDSKLWNESILPYFPNQFKFKLKEDPGVRKQYKIIRDLLNNTNITEIIEAGDADEEGNLLVSLVVADIMRRDNLNKRRSRLWSNSQSDSSILESLASPKEVSYYQNYSNSAYTRACIDFLLGINLTRKFTLMNNRLTGSRQVFSIGRCNTSIVRIIYERDMEIKNFKPIKYFQLESNEETNKEKIKLTLKEPRFAYNEFEKAKDLGDKLNINKAIVENIESTTSIKKPPKLFKLSKLQGLLSDMYKLSMKESYDIIQSLYEKGYVTYPRTNSEYLAEGDKPKVQRILRGLKEAGHNVEMKNTKSIFNQEKIESHGALIITDKVVEEGELTGNHLNVYNIIKNRFISNFLADDTKIDVTLMTITVGEYKFTLKGEVISEKGFYRYEAAPKNKDTNTLPLLNIGDQVNIKFKPIEKESKPPAKLTVKTLTGILENPFRKEKQTEDEEYKAMLEGVQIGTEATRTELIENTKKFGYISEKKGVLSIEPKGIYLIETLDKLNINISKEKTVEFSKLLKKVFRNEAAPNQCIKVIENEIADMFNNIKDVKIEGYKDTSSEENIIGKCPRCGKNIYENKKSYYCEGYKSEPKCTFSLWKEDKFFKDKGKKITKTIAKKFLTSGRAKVKGFKKKDGSGTYDATVVMNDTGKYVNFNMEF
ncbi:DNA topoisomerase [Clostridium baratii]|uniref:DNA topoisomerase n=1 Tax=Clostridium baratii TaxID=1561 RepID=UPI00097FA903|nr:DNA topoisomerase [Clostridium baratii]AQM58575.1 DNA topoisomerase III [Clostridium baratii]